MLHLATGAVAAIAFLIAGIVNLSGSNATRTDFVRWGYPAWWCVVTGIMEIGTAALIAWPATRTLGLIVGALIVGAAAATVIRRRDFSHLMPLAVYAVLLVVAFFI